MLCLVGCGFAPTPSATPGPSTDAPAPPSIDAFEYHDAPPACADDDHDGVCNAVDTWPCGPMPGALPTSIPMTANGTATSITLTSVTIMGTGQLVVAAPSSPMRVQLHYAITDTACAGNCIDQIELGWAPGDRAGCVFDGTVSKSSGATGNVDTSALTVPSAPGSYDLRANIGQNFSCSYNGASTWWGMPPAAARTIGKLCVH